jgi:alpha-galactosidase
MQGLVKAGLNRLNYTYFVVDEPCFAGRDENGVLIENATTWPHGLKSFGGELRSHGMALGVYTCVGPKTCGGCLASQGHEDQDVKTFAEWGVEYLKVDSCSRNCTPAAGIKNESTCGRELWSRYTAAIAKYPTIRGKQMVYSVIGNLAPGRGNPVWKWAAETRPFGIGNSWRTNIDIQGGFSSVRSIIDCQRRLSGNGSWCTTGPPPEGGSYDPPGFPCPAPNCPGEEECPGPEYYAGPGHWNDMDMLIIGTTTNTAPPFCANCTCAGHDPETGKPICTGCDGCARAKHWTELTLPQCRAQMSMWTILKSPLLASADLLAVNQSIIDVLANTEVLAVSDDPLGKEGLRLGDSGRHDKSVGEIYVGPMARGRYAVVMFNRGGNDAAMTFEEADLHSLMMMHSSGGGGDSSSSSSSSSGGGGGGGGGGGDGGSAGGWEVRDLWKHTDNGTLAEGGKITQVIPGGDVVMVTLTPLTPAKR